MKIDNSGILFTGPVSTEYPARLIWIRPQLPYLGEGKDGSNRVGFDIFSL